MPYNIGCESQSIELPLILRTRLLVVDEFRELKQLFSRREIDTFRLQSTRTRTRALAVAAIGDTEND